MSVIPTVLDSPDWTRNQGAGAATLTHQTVNVGAAANLGSFTTGGWRSLTIIAQNTGGGTQPYQLDIVWFADTLLTERLTTHTIEIEGGGQPTSVTIPVVAPMFTAALTRLAGAGVEGVTLTIIASPAEPATATGLTTRRLLAVNAQAIAVGAFVTLQPAGVANGVATITVACDSVNWYAQLRDLSGAGTLNNVVGHMNPYGALGKTERWGLQPLRHRLTVQNGDPGVIHVWATIDIDYQN